MNELGAGISIGVLAALVVFVIYLIAAKLGRWQPRSQPGGPGAGYGQAPQNQGGYGQGGHNQPTRAWSSEDETRVLPAHARGYDTAGYDDRDAVPPRATKAELAQNIQYSGQMIEANRRAATSSNGDTFAVFTYIFGAALIAVVAFVFFNNLLLPATIGALTGAIICGALPAPYTLYTLDFWPDTATSPITNRLGARAASIFLYSGAVPTQRVGTSLNSITDSSAPLPCREGFSGFAKG